MSDGSSSALSTEESTTTAASTTTSATTDATTTSNDATTTSAVSTTTADATTTLVTTTSDLTTVTTTGEVTTTIAETTTSAPTTEAATTTQITTTSGGSTTLTTSSVVTTTTTHPPQIVTTVTYVTTTGGGREGGGGGETGTATDSAVVVPTTTPDDSTDEPIATASSSSVGLDATGEWLLIAAGATVGVLLLVILVCTGVRYYCRSDKRLARLREAAEEERRQREMNEMGDEDDDPLGPLPPGVEEEGGYNEEAHRAAEEMEGAIGPALDRDLALVGSGGYGEGGYNEGSFSPNRGGGRSGSRGRGGKKEPAVTFVEVTDPVDMLAPIDSKLFQSLYESDEDAPPLHHRREASWMETDEDKRLRRAKRTRPNRGEARKRFDEYTRANQATLTAQQKAMYMDDDDHNDKPVVLRNIVNDMEGTDSESSDGSSSDDFRTNPKKMLPMSRAEAEQMRIEDLNAKVVERNRILKHTKEAHPHYHYQDPVRVASKALLSKSTYKAGVEVDRSAVSEREAARIAKARITGNTVPWGNREDDAAKDPIAKLQDLPWMTSDRVKAIAKEHTRSDKAQLKKQMEVEQYIMEDGRIDYEGKFLEGGGDAGSNPNASDGRAGGMSDRASSVNGGGGRGRRGGSPSERMSMRDRASSYKGDGRASTILKGSSRGLDTMSAGKSVTISRLAELNDGNARNSALSAADLRKAREAFGGSSYQRSSKDGGSTDDRRSSTRGSARRRARFDMSSAGSGNDRDSNLFGSAAGGEGGGGPDEEADDGDDDGLAALVGALGGRDATRLSKQELVDARSLSVLRAQLVESRAADTSLAGGMYDEEPSSPKKVPKGRQQQQYHNMNQAVLAPSSPERRRGDAEGANNNNGYNDYANLQPHKWHLDGDEQFFHLSPQPQRRMRRAADVADTHRIEGLGGTFSVRMDAAEESYYDAREERRRKMVAARRMAGIEVIEDEDSDYSDLSAGSDDVRTVAPVSVKETPSGTRVFRAFASPHQDPYLNML